MTDPLKPISVPINSLRVDPRGEGHGRGHQDQEHSHQEHPKKELPHKKAYKRDVFYGHQPTPETETTPTARQSSRLSLALRLLERFFKGDGA